jgi:hypothetical protein
MSIYNNVITSDMCSSSWAGNNCSAFIQLGGSYTNLNIFNNVLSATSQTQGYQAMIWLATGYLSNSGGNTTNVNILNNTIVSNNTPGGWNCECAGILSTAPSATQTGITVKNNIFMNFHGGNSVYLNTDGTLGAKFTGGIDNNVLYNVDEIGVDFTGNNHYTTLASWQSAGFDLHGSTGNPLLSALFAPQSGSTILSVGVNLSTMGMTALDSDKNGSPRPTSGPWAAGAYQGSVTAPAPPTSLAATVN